MQVVFQDMVLKDMAMVQVVLKYIVEGGLKDTGEYLSKRRLHMHLGIKDLRIRGVLTNMVQGMLKDMVQ